MSFQERRSIVNVIGTILITAFYSAYMIQRFPEGDAYSPDVFRFWGAFFLIELKAQTNSTYVFVVGVLLAMVSLVIDMPPSVMFVILICSGVVSEMVSEISKFYFYRRGF
jgi:hypothetical protein